MKSWHEVTIRIAAHTLCTISAFASFAVTNELENAILSFPSVNVRDFRPDEAVYSVNSLISAGLDETITSLKRVASKEWDYDYEKEEMNQRLCLMCRLAFTPKTPTEPLRPPRFGRSVLLPHPMKAVDWPYFPLAITNGVPLSLTGHYLQLARDEEASQYLAYCLSNGVFRTELFPGPTPITASNALNQVLTSPAWEVLRWESAGQEVWARDTLWQQVKSMTVPRVQRTRTSRSRIPLFQDLERLPFQAGVPFPQ